MCPWNVSGETPFLQKMRAMFLGPFIFDRMWSGAENVLNNPTQLKCEHLFAQFLSFFCCKKHISTSIFLLSSPISKRLNYDTKILAKTETFFWDHTYRNWNRDQTLRNLNPQKIRKSLETEKLRNRNVNLCCLWVSLSGIGRDFEDEIWSRFV